eukprot:SAG31_NODE_1530_length_7993_cov_7.079807_6_plen_89_part_00
MTSNGFFTLAGANDNNSLPCHHSPIVSCVFRHRVQVTAETLTQLERSWELRTTEVISDFCSGFVSMRPNTNLCDLELEVCPTPGSIHA